MSAAGFPVSEISPIRPRPISPWQIPLLYYLFYALCTYLNTFLLPQATVSLEATGIAVLFVMLMVASAWIANPVKPSLLGESDPAEAKLAGLIFHFLPPCIAALILFKWFALIRHYGSLRQIFAHAFAVRMNSIGKDGTTEQVLAGYGISLVFLVFTLALSTWLKRPTIGSVSRILMCIGLVFLNDLSMFARMGTLWAMLSCLSTVLIFRVESQINRKRILAIALAGFAVMSLPRMVRHGLLAELPGDDRPKAGMLMESFADTAGNSFSDYSSGLAAFSEFLHRYNQATYGLRTFTPLWRFANRVQLIDSGGYITTIDEPAENVSRTFNLYTVLRDLYQDFGLPGITIGGILVGAVYGWSFRDSGLLGRAITIYLTTWILYSTFYNAFSFGVFFIPFVLLIALQQLCRLPKHAHMGISLS